MQEQPFDPWRSAPPPESVEKLRAAIVQKRCFDRLLRVATRLARSVDEDDQHVAAALLNWLRDGGDLIRKLGLRTQRGRHRLKLAHRDEDGGERST